MLLAHERARIRVVIRRLFGAAERLPPGPARDEMEQIALELDAAEARLERLMGTRTRRELPYDVRDAE